VETLDLFRMSDNRRALSPGEVLFRVGDEADVMYAVVDGELEVIVGGTVVDTVEPGGMVGEMALITGDVPRSATVIASTASVVIPVDEEEFVRFVQTNPAFALEVLKLFADRLRQMNELLT
jgi:CRP-like cAMP-binding protein